MERTYTIPLRKGFMKTSKFQRTNRAVREVQIFLKKHMKTESIKLGEELNKALWARGDSKPPSRVTVLVKKEAEIAYAELVGKEFNKKDFSETEEKTATPKAKAEDKKPEVSAPVEQSAAELIGTAASKKAKEEAAEKPAAKKTAEKKTSKKE